MNEFFLNIEQFHFLRPEYFYLLLPLVALMLIKRFASASTQWHQVIPPHLAKVLLDGKQEKVKQNTFLLALLWLVAIAALAGPTWQKIEKPVFQVKRASVIVMDMSMSMRATDVKPDRLAKAKYKAIDLAKAIPDGEIALVAYAGDAFTISPLTPDSKNIVNLIPSLSPEIMPEPGSYPYAAITKAAELMQQAGFVKGDIYWFTDGIEIEDVDELRSYVASSRYDLNIMAFGTAKGAPISMKDKSLLKDHRGNIVIPKLNSQQLAQLATAGNGVFVRSTASDADIKTLLTEHHFPEQNSQEEESEDKLLTGDDWQEAGPYLVLLLLPFVLYAFRRGVTLTLLLGLVLLPNESAYAEEAEVQANSWTDFVFNTKDQVASKAFDRGQYSQAQATFDNQQWKGSAAYKAGDYEAALNYFQQDNSAQGLYNQGNALAQLNKLDEAIAAYDKALQQRRDYPQAEANKALLEQLKQQQQQQQQQEQQQQSDQQDQKGGQDQDQQQQSEQEQNSESQDQSGEPQSEKNQQGQSDSTPKPTEQNGDNKKSEEQNEQAQAEQNRDEQDQQEGEQKDAQQAQQQESEQAQQGQEQQTAELTPEQKAEQEAQQKLEQLLRKVSDDPSVLLRNKMILESRKRQQFSRPPGDVLKSW